MSQLFGTWVSVHDGVDLLVSSSVSAVGLLASVSPVWLGPLSSVPWVSSNLGSFLGCDVPVATLECRSMILDAELVVFMSCEAMCRVAWLRSLPL